LSFEYARYQHIYQGEVHPLFQGSCPVKQKYILLLLGAIGESFAILSSLVLREYFKEGFASSPESIASNELPSQVFDKVERAALRFEKEENKGITTRACPQKKLWLKHYCNR